MKKIINRVVLNDKEYIKILNIVEDRVVHINLFTKVKEGYLELFPGDIDEAIVRQAMNTKNDIPMEKEELLEFCNYLDSVRKKGKENFEKMFKEKGLPDTSINITGNMAGVEYMVVQTEQLPYAELLRPYYDEYGNIKGTSLVPLTHIDLIIVDIVPHMNLLRGKKLIQIENNNFYGLKVDGQTIVISNMCIDEDNDKLYCKKAYAVKKVGKVYSMYQVNEISKKLEEKIRNNVEKTMDYLWKFLLSDITIPLD